MQTSNKFLLVAAIGSGVAAALHLACIFFGGDWYRFFGAGEEMAQMAEAGHIYPTIVTLIITAILATWSLYALSGAGIIPRLPFVRWVLCIIAAIYLLRGLAFIPLMPLFPENSVLFWLVSSSICLIFGTCYALGTKQAWDVLAKH